MDLHWNSRPPTTKRQVAVRAPTLKEALRKVRQRYGPEAQVLESRTVMLRQDGSLSQEKAVEVVVTPAGQQLLAERRPAIEQVVGETFGEELTDMIAGEIARIEKLVQALGETRNPDTATADLQEYPLASELLAAGADLQTVRRHANALAADPNHPAPDHASALDHLRSALRTGKGRWRNFGGCHVFLGDSGVGKSDVVLASAAKLQASGRNTLVLNVYPKHGGEVRRLQLEAAQYCYDAALIKRAEQLIGASEHLAKYDVVLIDTPALFAEPFTAAGELQRFISQNESFHRHFVVPLDLDFRDTGDLWEMARLWNCDWLTLSRMDRTRRKGKILDLLGRLPLPISLISSGPWPESEPQIASAELLADLIIAPANHRMVARAEA